MLPVRKMFYRESGVSTIGKSHQCSLPTSPYVVVASSMNVTATLPLLRKGVYGYNGSLHETRALLRCSSSGTSSLCAGVDGDPGTGGYSYAERASGYGNTGRYEINKTRSLNLPERLPGPSASSRAHCPADHVAVRARWQRRSERGGPSGILIINCNEPECTCTHFSTNKPI